MLESAWLPVLLVAPILISAAICLTIGVSVIVRTTPLVVRGALLAWALTLTTLPLIAFALGFIIETFAPVACLLLVLPALILFSAWRSAQGVFIFGVTEADLRPAIQDALEGLELPFEETIFGYNLPSLNAELRVRMSKTLGTAYFQMDPRSHPREQTQVRLRIGDYLRQYGEANIAAALAYGFAGLVCLGLAAYQAGRF